MFADLEIDVHNANTWYNDNKLILNIHKSGCMLFGTRQGFHNNSNIEIILDGDVLQTYECTSYLGVDLINSLSWSQYIVLYIVKLCGKLAQRIGILRRIKQKVPRSSLVILYHTIIQPHIDYCLTVW